MVNFETPQQAFEYGCVKFKFESGSFTVACVLSQSHFI